MRLPDPPPSFAADPPPPFEAGVPADEEGFLAGVAEAEGDADGLLVRSTSFLSGEPEGDRPAAGDGGLDAGEEALEYKL